MRIERLQVETEGFLSGLDVTFTQGLNVIIGARGTGKTSIVELIRFCLSAGSFTDKAALEGSQQAIAILEGGAVALTLTEGGSSWTVTRSASGHVTSTGGPTTVECTVLAQNEVEAVGAQASGRLHLIDRFRTGREPSERAMNSLRAELRSLTVEINGLMAEGHALTEEVAALAPLTSELERAVAEQERLLRVSQATQEQQDNLQSLQAAGQVLAARESVVSQDAAQVQSFADALNRLRYEAPSILQQWPDYAGVDLLSNQRSAIPAIVDSLGKAAELLSVIQNGLAEARVTTTDLKAQIDSSSRAIRQQLDQAQTGIGLASRRVAELEAQYGHLQALRSRLEERRLRFVGVSADRDRLYDQLETLRDGVFAERETIVAALNQALSPAVRVRLNRSENVDHYRAAIIAGLRGSGIHYNSLAPQLAREVSPHELVGWVENGDAAALATVLGISNDRAASVINGLQSDGAADIIASLIEDGVGLDLLDGIEYKPSDRLSIGQRCTVVLPVLLGHHGDPLVMDQPEDHLDNAFIATTLVPVLSRRQLEDQFIFTSHNANIPVLGEAEWVVVMDSDGEHGFVSHQGPLSDPFVVNAVTRIMEGGKEAFASRAAFYEKDTRHVR
ncbi:AAA family ATPase [Cryobacterium sp. Hh7]|uniref:AAA family ATPase n=1 Tax=Cryobacterium sp. Hh7 TaxID=1259159 RepID=UPI00141A6ADE|nr:AAA family ATPase [Cryobacterium sp. Hh7]